MPPSLKWQYFFFLPCTTHSSFTKSATLSTPTATLMEKSVSPFSSPCNNLWTGLFLSMQNNQWCLSKLAHCRGKKPLWYVVFADFCGWDQTTNDLITGPQKSWIFNNQLQYSIGNDFQSNKAHLWSMCTIVNKHIFFYLFYRFLPVFYI